MENITFIIVGGLLIVIGILIAYKKQINLLHSYHYKNVREEDKDAFCVGCGNGNIICGIGIIVCGFLMPLGIVITVLGFAIVLYTIFKYNKGLF